MTQLSVLPLGKLLLEVNPGWQALKNVLSVPFHRLSPASVSGLRLGEEGELPDSLPSAPTRQPPQPSQSLSTVLPATSNSTAHPFQDRFPCMRMMVLQLFVVIEQSSEDAQRSGVEGGRQHLDFIPY